MVAGYLVRMMTCTHVMAYAAPAAAPSLDFLAAGCVCLHVWGRVRACILFVNVHSSAVVVWASRVRAGPLCPFRWSYHVSWPHHEMVLPASSPFHYPLPGFRPQEGNTVQCFLTHSFLLTHCLLFAHCFVFHHQLFNVYFPDAGGGEGGEGGPLLSPQLDGELAQALRHLSKKDPTTKVKALQVAVCVYVCARARACVRACACVYTCV